MLHALPIGIATQLFCCMKIRVPTLIISALAIMLVGCSSSPKYTEEQLAKGVRISGFYANISLDPKYSRARQIARVFGNPLNDVDPDKYLLNSTQSAALGGLIQGVVEGGPVGGLFMATVGATVSALSINRAHYDEWNAILNPAEFSTVYEAQAKALDHATQLTTQGLVKQGYQVIPVAHQKYNQEGSFGKWYDNVLTVVNEDKGCSHPTSQSDTNTCQVILRTLYYNAASRETPPSWLSDLKEALIIRSLAVLPEGKTLNGEAFTLSREDRESIAREASENYYFVGAFDNSHAGFVGENGSVAYCHLPPDELAKARKKDKKGVIERLSDNAKRNYEKHGWKSILWFEPLFTDEP